MEDKIFYNGLSYWSVHDFMKGKKEGFKNQLLIVCPGRLVRRLAQNPLTAELYLTDIGTFPQAPGHLVERPEGCSQYIFTYCHQGEGWVRYAEGKKQKVLPGEYFVIPAGQPHAYGSSEQDKWTLFWVHFDGAKAAEFFDCLVGGSAGNTYSTRGLDLELCYRLMLDLERSLTFANVAYASMALWGLFGRMIFPNASKESDVLEKSVQYMHDNLSKELSLSEIAIQSRLSPSRFSTLFKQHFETSPIDYLIHLRIQRACRYLQLSGMKIHEIAKQVGYEDPYYFSRVFSRVMGMSPSHFRKQ